MDSLFERPPRRYISELNIVPVIDLFTIVIFFLLLSTSFLPLNQLTVPPSQMTAATSSSIVVQLTPKMFLTKEGSGYRLILQWSGKAPGERVAAIPGGNDRELEKALETASRRLSTEFNTHYPKERTLQIGMGADVPYQALVSIMDGTREKIPDLVLVSYADVTKRFERGSP